MTGHTAALRAAIRSRDFASFQVAMVPDEVGMNIKDTDGVFFLFLKDSLLTRFLQIIIQRSAR